MPWKTEHLPDQVQEALNNRTLGIEPGFENTTVINTLTVPPLHRARHPTDLQFTETQRLADVSQRATWSIRDDCCGKCGTFPAILLIDVLYDFFTAFMLEVDVDVWWLIALFRNKSLDEHGHAVRVDLGNTKAIAHGRVRCGPAALAKNSL